MPWVSRVSTSPSTVTARSLNGPSVLGDHGQTAEHVERAFRGERMGDVAEGVLMMIEPAIYGDVHTPARHVLAVVVARGQPQHLDHAGRGRPVDIARQVRDADAHEANDE